VVGDGTARKGVRVKRGDLLGQGRLKASQDGRARRRAGVRASIVASRRGNARGAKGRRKADG
jgi:hypothetical protein